MDLTNSDNEPSWEEEENERLQKKISEIKKFTLENFLNFPPTKKLILDEHYQKFLDTAGKNLSIFYNEEHIHTHRLQSSLFHFDTDKTQGGKLNSIVYNNIKKIYDLEQFYSNPNLAQPLITYENNKPKENKKIFKPVKKKVFDWKTKTYK